MEHEFMHTLPKLGIFFRQEHNANSSVAGTPRFAAIVGTVNPASGNRGVDALPIGGVWHDSVQNQAAIAGHPTRPMSMFVQPADQGDRKSTRLNSSHSQISYA